MRLVIFAAFLALASLTLASCVTTDTDLKALDETSLLSSSSEPKLQAGDKLKVNVFGEDKLTGDYQIDRAGKLTLPLVGELTATGLTRTALERALEARLTVQYLRNPKVSIVMASFMPFYILGEVEKPGRYDYEGGLNVWRAIALAGGQTYRASSSTVFIQRAGDRQWQEFELSPALAVDPGDLIRVPDRWF